MNSVDIFNIPIVVLCGGEGKRFREVSQLYPKLIAPLPDGQTYLDWLLHTFTFGFNNIILATGHMHDHIYSYVQSLPFFHRSRITFSQELFPLGTGGALLNVKSIFHYPFAVVLNGDTINDINLYQFISDSIQAVPFYSSVACINDSMRSDAGSLVVSPENRILSFYEKEPELQCSSLISRGLYVFNVNSIPSHFSANCSIEYDIIPYLIHKFPSYAHCYPGSSLDIGTFERFLSLHNLPSI